MSDRIPRLLVPDTTPLSLLSMIGDEALDWLFLPGVEVWITDMVFIEALREPEQGADRRTDQRATLQAWFVANEDRIRIQLTQEGQDYERGMRNWLRGGRVAEDRPIWRGQGERSMQDLLPVIEQIMEEGQSVVLLVDDRSARALLVQAARLGGVDVDMMATESFLAMLEQDYGVLQAKDAWLAISLAAGGRQPATPIPDPVYVRRI